MKKIHGALALFVKRISIVAAIVAFALMLITTIDVILRKVPFIPLSIRGSYDMTEMGMVIIVFFGIAYLQSEHGHVRVDMFVDKFPRVVKHVVEGVVNLFEAVVAGVICVSAFQQISVLYNRGANTSVAHLPHWFFAIFMAIGLAFFTIFLLLDAIMDFAKIANDDAGKGEIQPDSSN